MVNFKSYHYDQIFKVVYCEWGTIFSKPTGQLWFPIERRQVRFRLDTCYASLNFCKEELKITLFAFTTRQTQWINWSKIVHEIISICGKALSWIGLVLTPQILDHSGTNSLENGFLTKVNLFLNIYLTFFDITFQKEWFTFSELLWITLGCS